MVEESKIDVGDQNCEIRDQGQEVDSRGHTRMVEEKEKGVEEIPGKNGNLPEQQQGKSRTEREETLPIGSSEDQPVGSPEMEEVEETQFLENLDNLDMVEVPRESMESPKVQAGKKEILMEEAVINRKISKSEKASDKNKEIYREGPVVEGREGCFGTDLCGPKTQRQQKADADRSCSTIDSTDSSSSAVF
ncbi:hypothetical protein L6452_09526 [Arctium lappa]|uniref:Uncharacterized protein n=1 Tax=Arctium lappa TaxID=4217 RepID=A0ACB9DKU9_ARCLA|nr:hypothetical protein L6452_09526 [Arctium lappa]